MESNPGTPGNGPQQLPEVTQFLLDLRAGRASPSGALLPIVYERLRQTAERLVQGQQAGQSLHPTDLVHEVYLKLFDPSQVTWNDRTHFYALAARAMRQLLVDHARRRRLAPRRDVELDQLEDSLLASTGADVDLLDLDAALGELAALDERESRVVELRFFGGLDMQQVADVLGVSKSSVERDWVTARAWLGRRLKGGNP